MKNVFWTISAFYPFGKKAEMTKKRLKKFLDHIRVLSFWIKRGYDLKKDEKRFLIISAFHPFG
jgi:hypothetical protein